jgi:hypothetical protein
MCWINLTYDQDKWLGFVNKVMNTGVNFLKMTLFHGVSLSD